MGFVAEILGFKKPKQQDLTPPLEVNKSTVAQTEKRRLLTPQRTNFTGPGGLLSNTDTKGKTLLGE